MKSKAMAKSTNELDRKDLKLTEGMKEDSRQQIDRLRNQNWSEWEKEVKE